MYKMSPAQFANLSSRERILAGMAGLSASRNATETYHESGAKQGFVHEGGSFTDMIHATLNAPNVGTIISGGSHVVSNTPAEFELTPHWREGYTRLPGSAVMPGHQGVQSRGLRGFLAGLGVFAPEAMGESTRGGQTAAGRSTGTVAPPGAGGPAAGSGVRTVAAVMGPANLTVVKTARGLTLTPIAATGAQRGSAGSKVANTGMGPGMMNVDTTSGASPTGASPVDAARRAALIAANSASPVDAARPPGIWTVPPGMKAPVYTGSGANTGTEGSSGSGGSGTAQTLPDTGSGSASTDTGSGGSGSSDGSGITPYSTEGNQPKPSSWDKVTPGVVAPSTPWALIGGLVAVAGAVWYYSK